MKKIKKRLVAFLCLFCAVITIFPAKNTVYASESVSAEEKEKVEKYVMGYIGCISLLCRKLWLESEDVRLRNQTTE